MIDAPSTIAPDALAALVDLCCRAVPGCDEVSLEVIADGAVIGRRPGVDPDRNPDSPRLAVDSVSLALLSGPIDDDGQLMGVLNLFAYRTPFGPEAAEPAALVARVAAALLSGRHSHGSRRSGPVTAVRRQS